MFSRLRSTLPSGRRVLYTSLALTTATTGYILLNSNDNEPSTIPSDPSQLYYRAKQLRLDAPRPVGSDSDRPGPTWTPPTRHAMLKELKKGGMKDEEFDLLIVGGGATGSGIALDAAARGLKVGLVERDDFSSGESIAKYRFQCGEELLREARGGNLSRVGE